MQKCVRVSLAGSVALLSPTQRWSPATVSVFRKVRRPSSLKLFGKNAHGNWSQHVAAKCGVGNASEQPISARTWIFSVVFLRCGVQKPCWLMMVDDDLAISGVIQYVGDHQDPSCEMHRNAMNQPVLTDSFWIKSGQRKAQDHGIMAASVFKETSSSTWSSTKPGAFKHQKALQQNHKAIYCF